MGLGSAGRPREGAVVMLCQLLKNMWTVAAPGCAVTKDARGVAMGWAVVAIMQWWRWGNGANTKLPTRAVPAGHSVPTVHACIHSISHSKGDWKRSARYMAWAWRLSACQQFGLVRPFGGEGIATPHVLWAEHGPCSGPTRLSHTRKHPYSLVAPPCVCDARCIPSCAPLELTRVELRHTRCCEEQ